MTDATLANFDVGDFLQNYWQQKPLLIRQGLPELVNPLSPDELAGLACEDSVESRLIVQRGQQYELARGPFSEQRFQLLPNRDWTLLVQAVDHYVPEVAALLNHFRFIPNWRIDDVMVSFAVTGGSVGPHYDNYDVFLIQGQGSRRWQVGPKYSCISPLQVNDQLKLLDDFTAEQDWQLMPGDILYLPPQFGHWGVAETDDCMTYSVGFRAPAHAEILSGFCDDQLDRLSDELRYTDAGTVFPDNPGEITPKVINKIHQILQQQLNNHQNIGDWFARFMTEPKYENELDQLSCPISSEDLTLLLNRHGCLCRNSSSRFAFIRQGHIAQLYVNGNQHTCPEDSVPLAELLSASDRYTKQQLSQFLNNQECVRLITELINQGCLYFDDGIQY